MLLASSPARYHGTTDASGPETMFAITVTLQLVGLDVQKVCVCVHVCVWRGFAVKCTGSVCVRVYVFVCRGRRAAYWFFSFNISMKFKQ